MPNMVFGTLLLSIKQLVRFDHFDYSFERVLKLRVLWILMLAMDYLFCAGF